MLRHLARCCRRLPPPRPPPFSDRFHKVGVQFATVNSYEIISTSKSMCADALHSNWGAELGTGDADPRQPGGNWC